MGKAIKGICYIIGGYLPEFNPDIVKSVCDDDFVICADRGLEAALKYKIKPDLIIGDFDSYSGDLPKDIEIIRLPVKKDDSDLHFAAKKALELGAERIVLSGVTGGRADMTLASYSTLNFLKISGADAKICDFSVSVYLTDRKISVKKPDYDCYFSVFPFGERSEGVSIFGGLYLAENINLTDYFPIGVSNSFDEDIITVSVKKGKVIILVVKKV